MQTSSAKLLILTGLLLCPATYAAPAIEVVNCRTGEEIRYPIALIRGQVANQVVTEITVINTSSFRPTRERKGIVHNRQFKLLAELVPGENALVLQAGSQETRLVIKFRPQTNPYFVRAVYLTDKTGDTAYQTPDPNDPQDYAGRIDTALKLMQTFTGERLNDLGFGRRTFNLELDDQGKVIVHVHMGKLAASEYWAMKDNDWYDHIAKELGQPFPMRRAKNFAIAAYSRFDPATGKTRGHTALGGGGLGLFGSGNLYTWPASLAEVQSAFMDARPIDTKKTQNDSAGRSNYWGAASTTIGACLHEMAHTFGLPHTREPLDIMTRGFDRFNRAFTFVEPWKGKPATEFKPDRCACFAPISASCLLTSRWFAMDNREWRDDSRPTITRNKQTGEIVIEDQFPIRYVNISVKGDSIHFIVPPENQKRIVIPMDEIKQKTGTEPYRIRAINDQGNATGRNSEEL